MSAEVAREGHVAEKDADAPRPGVLAQEHALLGAEFEASERTGLLGVCAYVNEEPASHVREGAFLADLTGLAYELVSGDEAAQLAELAFAGQRLDPGEAAFEACLLGDGAVVSAPLVVRTGAHEYVAVDVSERGDALASWLAFLARVEQGGQRAFPETEVTDASGMLVPLLLLGEAAERVLLDYVSAPSALPEAGEAVAVNLDAISTVVARVPLPAGAAASYLVLVPPAAARTLWRSLLSFPEVAPAGRGTLRELAAALPWAGALAGTDRVTASGRDLTRWGLLREGAGYVGARGLQEASREAEAGPSPKGGER